MFGALNGIKCVRSRSLLVFSLGGEKTLLCTNSTRLVALVPVYVTSFAHQSRWLPTITRRKDRAIVDSSRSTKGLDPVT